MTGTIEPATGTVHVIDQDLSVADAREALTSLNGAAKAAGPESPLGLELTGTHATAPALQLLIAGAGTLAAAGAFAGFGPTAAKALGAVSVNTPSAGSGTAP
ncbi:MAG: hypothetical protein ACK4GT_08945 [Pararhodobacter sp.]